ncbi:NINE protein [Yeosuana sp. AK3]
MSEEKNFNDDLKDKAKEFTEEAKESASEFAENAKETFTGSNKKILAGVLAIFLGVFGVHKFVLGYTKEGVIILVITLILGILTCGIAGWVMCVLGLIEGIIYLTKSDEEFYNTYQVGKKPWF